MNIVFIYIHNVIISFKVLLYYILVDLITFLDIKVIKNGK